MKHKEVIKFAMEFLKSNLDDPEVQIMAAQALGLIADDDEDLSDATLNYLMETVDVTNHLVSQGIKL